MPYAHNPHTPDGHVYVLQPSKNVVYASPAVLESLPAHSDEWGTWVSAPKTELVRTTAELYDDETRPGS